MTLTHISHTFSLKKWLSAMVFAGFATALLFGSLFTFHPIAKASSATCYDVVGQGTQVLKGGVPNSGVLDFETLVPAYAYEGCVEDGSFPLGTGPFDVKGWVWDTNLGWVSLYCADELGNGAPYENLGISCGNVQYGVTMEGSGGANPGRLSGFAWSDNAGYISFNCANTGTCGTSNYYVEVETSQGPCLGQIFSGSPPAGCVARANESTFAWSDNVGWVDLAGVTMPWIDLIGLGVDVELEVLSNDGATDLLSVNKNTAPAADGNERYYVVLHMTKSIDGTPVDTPSDYAVTLSAGWNDSVDFDQTDSNAGSHDAANTGAVEKFFDFSAFDAYGTTVADGYVAEVTSLAPTSSMNGYDEGGDGSVDSSNEDFVLGGPGSPLPTNALSLQNLSVSAVHTPTSICAFGSGVGCAAQDVSAGYGSQAWHFRPAVDVAEFSDSINNATISARHLVANSIDFTLDCLGSLSSCPGTITTHLGVDSPFEFVYDSNDDGADCTDISSQFNLYDAFTAFGSPLQLTPVFEDDGLGGCKEGIAESEGENAYVYTEVEYQNAGQTIHYYSSKLPRVQGTLVVNPVADISGNVYSTGVTNPQTGQEVRSLGDVSTNILRDTISRNVETIVAGIEAPIGSAPAVNSWDGGTDGFNISGAYASLLPDILYDKPKVFYFTQDLHINALDWVGERTFIVKGADVFIDGDIYSTTPSAKLGIIVLKDLSSGNGGNVYIDPGVKNIQANIFADGSVFSWRGNNAATDINGDGEPVWTDESERFNLLKNQLYIQGSIASQNTIGGAVRSVPILGDGTVASASEGQYGATPTGRSQARLYDLNFLRYYGLVFERDGSGNAVDQQGDLPGDPGYLQLDYVGNGGDLVLITGGDPATGLSPTEDFSAVYVEFDPPTLGLPGFSTTGGVDIRLLP
ncbi:hypothetical protein KC725_05445 [Candidatus Peregrinibacteria bacterium]|nr:hypothetical protein [Candidatus Peregrinibacteria bacterium]